MDGAFHNLSDGEWTWELLMYDDTIKLTCLLGAYAYIEKFSDLAKLDSMTTTMAFIQALKTASLRSEERRVGKEC